MIEVSTIRDFVTIFGVIAGFSYYVLTVRNTNRARKTQVVLNLSNLMYSEETNRKYLSLLSMQWEDFDDFLRKYDSTINPDHFAIRWRQWTFYNNLGYMLNQKIVDVDMVYNMVGGPSAVQFWDKFRPIVMEQRKMYNDPSWFKWWEYLMEEIHKYREENNLTSNLETDVYKTEYDLPT
jgi:hypothetical protein